MLRAGGLSPVDFGTPADETVAALTERFGAPDRDEALGPGRECVEGDPWRDCLLMLDAGRLLGWTRLGLEVALTDADLIDGEVVATPLHFAAWRAVPPVDGTALGTEDGLTVGDSVGELRRIYPDVQFHFGEGGVVDAFVIETADGTIHGELAWGTREDYVRAVQQLLIQRGADIEVDGEWDTSTEQAWADLLGQYGGEPGASGTVPLGLGFPPADFLVESLDAAG